MSWQQRWVRAMVDHRRWVLAAVGLISVVAAIFAAQVRFDSSIEIWFLEDDPDLISYRAFLERFGADELQVIGIFAEDVFDPAVLAAIDRITERAATAPYAHRVQSLSNVEVFRSPGGGIEIAPLYAEPPTTAAAATAVAREALETPLIRGNLVAPDGNATAILIEMDPAGNTFAGKKALMTALREIVAEEAPPQVTVRYAGSPHLDEAFADYSERDYAVFGPVMVLLVLLVSFLVFRRWSAALIPLAVVGLANLWLFGAMGALGVNVNIVSSALTAVILAVGVADTIHVLSEYYQHLMAGDEPETAVVSGTSEVLTPCLVTSTTTAAGFLSLLVSNLVPIREFGWLAALGVIFAFLLSVTVVPAILHLVKAPDPAYLERRRRGPITRLLTPLGRPRRRPSIAVAAAAFALAALAVAGLLRLEVGANVMNYFKQGDPVRVHTEAIDRALGGSTSVEILVETDPGGLKDPAVLQRIERMAAAAAELPGVAHVVSITDVLRELDRVLDQRERGRLPDSRALAAQYYLLLSGEEDLDALVEDGYGAARITARVNLSEAGALVRRIDDLEQRVAELSDERVQFHITGYIKLMENMESYLVESQFNSFLAAFLVISLMMFLLLRSVRLGLFAMIPNLFPVLVGLGFMGWVGIALDAGTVMIAGIALGLVVDDTVHFLFRLQQSAREGGEIEAGIERAIHQAGRPILITSVILAAGFSVLALGTFTPNIYFGLVTGLVILVAVAADLVVLPALLVLIRPRLGGGGPRDAASTPPGA